MFGKCIFKKVQFFDLKYYKYGTLGEKSINSNMFCLHGKPAVTATTDKGTFWFCGEPSSCQLICPEEHELLYNEAVQKFLKTDQPRPVCCGIEGTDERNYARIRVVRDASKASFGRPFFVCSKDKDQCQYFEWGDEIIEPKPLCQHGKPCTIQKVKKEGRNQGRYFLCCAEPRKDSCGFFKWHKQPNPTKQLLPPLKVLRAPANPAKPADSPLEPGSIVFFTNLPSYQYTVKDTGLKFTSSESNPTKAYAEFVRKNKLFTPPKRSFEDNDDDNNDDNDETPPKKTQKRKSKPKKKIINDVREKINNGPPAQCPQPPAQKNFLEDFKMSPACKEELEDYSEDSQQC